MTLITYVNGRYLPHKHASTHIEDRGYQFGDGVYEVCQVDRGFLIDGTRHLNRLERSLRELSIRTPLHRNVLEMIIRQVIHRNKVFFGSVYIQVTRGVAQRNHSFPSHHVSPTLVITSKKNCPKTFSSYAEKGLSILTVPENRWGRVDIKSTILLPNILALEKAKKEGADEAWFVNENGFVTEGTSCNSWILTDKNILVTHPANGKILQGITRTTLLELVKQLNVCVEERPFSVSEALCAHESFITSATKLIMPVVKINGTTIGNGTPGLKTLEFRRLFFDFAEKTSIW